jgi:hypothetical protein
MLQREYFGINLLSGPENHLTSIKAWNEEL